MDALNKFCKVIKGKYLTELSPKFTTSGPSPKIKSESDGSNSNPKKRSYESDSEPKFSPKK